MIPERVEWSYSNEHNQLLILQRGILVFNIPHINKSLWKSIPTNWFPYIPYLKLFTSLYTTCTNSLSYSLAIFAPVGNCSNVCSLEQVLYHAFRHGGKRPKIQHKSAQNKPFPSSKVFIQNEKLSSHERVFRGSPYHGNIDTLLQIYLTYSWEANSSNTPQSLLSISPNCW